MATNEILPFATTNTGTNLLTQSEYVADEQRPIGHQPGIARSKLANKAMRQASLISAGLAEFIADYQGNNVTDSLTPQQVADYLLDALINTVMPAGTIIYVPQTTSPDGFLKANGAAVSRSTYSRLFSKIGTAFGVGNGSTTFNLPDLRGEFLRCLDDGRGIDAGRTMGSWQKGSLAGMDSEFDAVWNIATTSQGGPTNYSDAGMDVVNPANYPNMRLTGLGGPVATNNLPGATNSWSGVTRPRNIALLACIKY